MEGSLESRHQQEEVQPPSQLVGRGLVQCQPGNQPSQLEGQQQEDQVAQLLGLDRVARLPEQARAPSLLPGVLEQQRHQPH